jgi:hypothetical protein
MLANQLFSVNGHTLYMLIVNGKNWYQYRKSDIMNRFLLYRVIHKSLCTCKNKLSKWEVCDTQNSPATSKVCLYVNVCQRTQTTESFHSSQNLFLQKDRNFWITLYLQCQKYLTDARTSYVKRAEIFLGHQPWQFRLKSNVSEIFPGSIIR